MSKTFISDGKPHKIVMTIPRKYDAYYYIDGNFIYHLNTEGYYWKDRDDNTIYGYEKPSYINFSIYIYSKLAFMDFRIDYLRLVDRVLDPKEFFNPIPYTAIYYFPIFSYYTNKITIFT